MTSLSQTNPSTLNLRRFVLRNFRVGITLIILLALLGVTVSLNGKFFTPPVLTSTSNQSMTLVFAGMAQTTVVTTGGIDLSVGPIISMSNSLASAIFSKANDGLNIVIVIVIVLGVATLAGLINGLIVVYGRLQPIIVTLATSSIYSGVALYLRPRPGGFVPDVYGDLLTRRVGQLLPESL